MVELRVQSGKVGRKRGIADGWWEGGAAETSIDARKHWERKRGSQAVVEGAVATMTVCAAEGVVGAVSVRVAS